MKQNELTKWLRNAGCVILRHGGRHDIWINPANNKTQVVPRHGSKEIPKGTLNSIKKGLFGE